MYRVYRVHVVTTSPNQIYVLVTIHTAPLCRSPPAHIVTTLCAALPTFCTYAYLSPAALMSSCSTWVLCSEWSRLVVVRARLAWGGGCEEVGKGECVC